MKNRKQIIIQFLIMSGILFSVNSIYGQRSGYYYHYEFEQFLITYTTDAESYKKEFLDNLQYLAICRENKQEGDVEFLVFHHGDGEFEIIQKEREHKYFEMSVNYAFKMAKGKMREGIKEKFMMIIKIRFDIEPFENNKEFDFHFIKTSPKIKPVTIMSHH